MSLCGSRSHSTIAEAASSIAEIASCRTASAAGGSCIFHHRPRVSDDRRSHSHRNPTSTSSMIAAARRRTQPWVCVSSARSCAPHNSPTAAKNSMPRPNAAALNTITRAICGGSTPAAAYRRIRTTPPDSGPSPIVLDNA